MPIVLLILFLIGAVVVTAEWAWRVVDAAGSALLIVTLGSAAARLVLYRIPTGLAFLLCGIGGGVYARWALEGPQWGMWGLPPLGFAIGVAVVFAVAGSLIASPLTRSVREGVRGVANRTRGVATETSESVLVSGYNAYQRHIAPWPLLRTGLVLFGGAVLLRTFIETIDYLAFLRASDQVTASVTDEGVGLPWDGIYEIRVIKELEFDGFLEGESLDLEGMRRTDNGDPVPLSDYTDRYKAFLESQNAQHKARPKGSRSPVPEWPLGALLVEVSWYRNDPVRGGLVHSETLRVSDLKQAEGVPPLFGRDRYLLPIEEPKVEPRATNSVVRFYPNCDRETFPFAVSEPFVVRYRRVGGEGYGAAAPRVNNAPIYFLQFITLVLALGGMGCLGIGVRRRWATRGVVVTEIKGSDQAPPLVVPRMRIAPQKEGAAGIKGGAVLRITEEERMSSEAVEAEATLQEYEQGAQAIAIQLEQIQQNIARQAGEALQRRVGEVEIASQGWLANLAFKKETQRRQEGYAALANTLHEYNRVITETSTAVDNLIRLTNKQMTTRELALLEREKTKLERLKVEADQAEERARKAEAERRQREAEAPPPEPEVPASPPPKPKKPSVLDLIESLSQEEILRLKKLQEWRVQHRPTDDLSRCESEATWREDWMKRLKEVYLPIFEQYERYEEQLRDIIG